jgi:hypothetical protein
MPDMSSEQTLIFHLREARAKAVEAAKYEALALLKDFRPELLKGGPLSERGGVFWVRTPVAGTDLRRVDYGRLGYSVAADLVVPIPESNYRENRADMTRFKGRPVKLERLHELDAATPDQTGAHEGCVEEIEAFSAET